MAKVILRGFFLAGSVEGESEDVVNTLLGLGLQPAVIQSLLSGPQGGGNSSPEKGTTFLPDSSSYASFYRSLLDTQRPVIDIIFAGPHEGITDDELREKLGKASNKAIAGLFTGIGKRAEAAQIPIDKIIDPQGRPKVFKLTPQFREALKDVVGNSLGA